MNNKTITFSDIETRDLLYYDPDFRDTCLRFCRDRNIDCLPSLDDPLRFYQKNEPGFSEEIVTSERMVGGWDFIFEKSLLARFRANHLLFVFENKVLTGVVHFSDYNRSAVTEYLFCLLSAYERSLRKLLALCGMRNQEMLDYFQRVVQTAKKEDRKSIYRDKLESFETRRNRFEKLPDFERFYLKDLIELVKDQKIIVVSEDEVNTLRNDVMHVHELVTMHDAHRDDYIYNFDSFKTFFERVLILLRDFKRVNNRIAFLELTRMEK